jgi:hypothetical protein
MKFCVPRPSFISMSREMELSTFRNRTFSGSGWSLRISSRSFAASALAVTTSAFAVAASVVALFALSLAAAKSASIASSCLFDLIPAAALAMATKIPNIPQKNSRRRLEASLSLDARKNSLMAKAKLLSETKANRNESIWLNRLTLCFSKKLRNLEAAFGMFAALYNFCWQTRKPGKSGQKRPTAAMMAKLAGDVWSFDELFDAVLAG